MSLLTSSTKMITIFESVEELIAACKMKNSLLWMAINDLEKDYHRGHSENDTIEKLEEIFDTLEALTDVVTK